VIVRERIKEVDRFRRIEEHYDLLFKFYGSLENRVVKVENRITKD
jgi:hypothetical protein